MIASFTAPPPWRLHAGSQSGEAGDQRQCNKAPEGKQRHRAGLAVMRGSASVWIYRAHCFTDVRQWRIRREGLAWLIGEGIWSRGGVNVEELPDPFAPAASPDAAPEVTQPEAKPKRSRRRIIVLFDFAAFLLVILLWLIVTAPLSRALEPLDDPAMLLLTQEGRPIARRGAIKEAPVDIAKLDPLTPAAFVAIEDRRFYRHWGIDPRAIGRAMVANVAGGRRAPGRQHDHPAARQDQLPVEPTAASSARRRK